MANETPPSPVSFAATTLMEHLAALSAQLPGVRDASDTECVHQVRVASRRLRNALDLFRPVLPKGKRSRWQKQAKRITKALSVARDADVQIQTVELFLIELRKDSQRAHLAGVERLLLRLTQHREAIQPEVLKTLDKLARDQVLEAMRQELIDLHMRENTRAERPGKPGKSSKQTPDLIAHARKTIDERYVGFMAYEPFIHNPQHVAELHAMRIASKHLRYTLETFAPLFKGKFKAPIKLGKQVQTLLGDIHDEDVWIDMLPRFIEEERQRQEAFFGHLRGFARIDAGLKHLQQKRIERRDALYRQFISFWKKQVAADGWVKLRESVQQAQPRRTDPAKAPSDAPAKGMRGLIKEPVEVPAIADRSHGKRSDEKPADDARGSEARVNADDDAGSSESQRETSSVGEIRDSTR